jgi:hypothetical protein
MAHHDRIWLSAPDGNRQDSDEEIVGIGEGREDDDAFEDDDADEEDEVDEEDNEDVE